MTSQHDKPKRWPRFSVRTLVILVTLVCCYAACWGPTKEYGVEAVASRRIVIGYKADPIPIAPLLVAERTGKHSHRYYFWFFRYIAKLPFE
jgi:hypothetical protein